MNMLKIAERAASEATDFQTWEEVIKAAIKTCPSGTDIQVPKSLIEAIERHCDDRGIPCHAVAEDTISVALSYSQLLTYENRRKPLGVNKLGLDGFLA